MATDVIGKGKTSSIKKCVPTIKVNRTSNENTIEATKPLTKNQ